MTGSAKVIRATDWQTTPGRWSGRVEGEALGTDLTLLLYASEADGDSVPLHAHAYDEVFLVRDGRLRYAVGGDRVEAGPGDVLLAPAGFDHGFERVGEARASSVNLHLARRPSWAAAGALVPAPGARARRVARADWSRPDDPGSGRVEGRDLGARLTILFFRTEAAGKGPPLHVHAYDEVFVIRRGRAEFTVGDQVFEAAEGDIVFGPAGVPHRFRTLGPFETTDLHLSDRFEQTNLQ